MIRHLGACLLVLAAAATTPAAPTLKEARQRWLRGNYEEARETYEQLAKDPKTRAAARIGISRTWQSQGEYDKALAVIDTALKDEPRSADLHARRAELLYLRGRWEEAEKHADTALDLNKQHFLARWVRAQVYRDRGELTKADQEFRWFVRTYTERSNNDDDIKDPDELLIVGQAGAENARWHKLADQFPFILDEVYGDALKYDKDLWQAEYLAGMLLLEKYNRGEAIDAFDKALKINPSAAEPLVGKGMAALQRLEYKDAEQFAEQALKLNPHLPEALRLQADVRLGLGDLAGALRDLEKARTINPRDEETLGRIAACFFLQRREADFDTLVKQVEKQNAKPGVFYYYLAERLEERRRFDDAERFYKKSAELRPMVPWAQNSLGLLYMRLGRENEAREILTKAFEADPFNVRVANTIKVLRHLDRYETIKTDHFELRFDPVHDRVLARYMAEYLEEIYAELADKFQYQPKGPILVEVFNNHDMFSGRVIALPDLHTIGACTGRMVAMVSPHGKGVRRPFNWARVLRHELVHIFNLEQTGFQVPHWLTEGLAVLNENFPRPQLWNQLLLERVPSGELMNLDNIDLGFMRPRSPLDWNMAYCQSQLYVEYLKEKHGPQAIGELLNAYRDGLDTASAIKKVCKVDKEVFEKGYRAYLQEVVKSLKGKPAEKRLTFTELRRAYDKDPTNPDLCAQLAEQYRLRGQRAEARKLADAALARNRNHPLAVAVKARLLLLAGDAESAKEILKKALEAHPSDVQLLKELGKLCYEAGEFAEAAAHFEQGHQVEPYDREWLLQLAKVYAQTSERDKQIRVLKELVPMDADDLEHRKRLARLLSESGRHAEAERYARQALEIDIRDADCQAILIQSLKAQKKEAEAERMQKLLAK
ncbi:MAG TPA: tetratricopeptide repeat protein [Gemmataceae bacterium]|nr:tetratricopeptide repeat protein [Gemmataceae bacterium]